MNAAAPTITGLLQAIQRGEREALSTLFPLVYDELLALAHRQRLSWHGDFTLNTTAVVHEAYLKLVDQKRLPAESRAHFFAVAAKVMRHILSNYARDRNALKRGGAVQHVDLTSQHDVATQFEFSEDQIDTLTALENALHRLEQIAGRQSRVVECRFFGGMSVEETATALDISVRTVKRDWSFARAWLRREMKAHSGPGSIGDG
jgi:RNA polymerase sigma factor (TIGR02999 family)